MNFEIPSDEVRLAHLNVRSEKHGDEEVTAVDLKLEWTTSNAALTAFHPDLRAALYSAQSSAQPPLNDIESHLPVRVFPDLGPLKWTKELTGMRLVILHGLGGKSDLILPDCSVDKFVIEPLEGGSVEITFRVQVVCKDEKILGKLATLLHRDLPLTLVRQNPVDDEVSTVTPLKGRGRKAAPTATDIFAGSSANE